MIIEAFLIGAIASENLHLVSSRLSCLVDQMRLSFGRIVDKNF
jgi:hypothetical protein